MKKELTYQILIDKKNVIVGWATSSGSVSGAPEKLRWVEVSEEVYRSADIETSSIGKYMYNETDNTIYENPDFAAAAAEGKTYYNYETGEFERPSWGKLG